MPMNAIALSHPRTIPFLTAVVCSLIAVYVALMITTFVFASLQTHLAQEVQGEQKVIAKLEDRYYSQIAALDSTDPQAIGYVKPAHVTYLTQTAVPGLTFAGN